MKFDCDCCHGRGYTDRFGNDECYECDGLGYYGRDIFEERVWRTHKDYDELVALQQDAKNILAAQKQLINNKPQHRGSYELQYKKALQEIEQKFFGLLEE